MREGPLLEQEAVESLTLETLLNAVERAARAVEGKRFAFKLQEKTGHVPTLRLRSYAHRCLRRSGTRSLGLRRASVRVRPSRAARIGNEGSAGTKGA